MLRRRDCYQDVPDPTLPHQVGLHWEGMKVVASCNCGRQIGVYAPERVDVAVRAKADYDKHIDVVMKKQAAQSLWR